LLIPGASARSRSLPSKITDPYTDVDVWADFTHDGGEVRDGLRSGGYKLSLATAGISRLKIDHEHAIDTWASFWPRDRRRLCRVL